MANYQRNYNAIEKLSNTSTDNSWDDFDQGLRNILSGKRLQRRRFLQLHTFIFDFDGDSHPPIGEEIYVHIKHYLEHYLLQVFTEMKDLAAEDILKIYCDRWENYQRSTYILNKTCSHLNRNWIYWSRSANENSNILNIDKLALSVWKDQLSNSTGKSVVDALLKLIDKERHGEVVDTNLVGKVINSFVSLGSTTYYKEVFENIFFAETKKFYSRESAEIFDQLSISEYLTKIEIRLIEEENRVQNYLVISTLDPLLKICFHVFVEKRFDVLMAKFKFLKAEDKKKVTPRIYKLLQRFSYFDGTCHATFFSAYYMQHFMLISR